MVANIRGYTPNYNFKLINFDTPRWHTLEYSNWNMVDAMFLQGGIPQLRGGWQNSTLYLVGERVFDEETSAVYRCVIENTSAPTGTFAEDRTARPTLWSLQLAGTPVFRGEWLPAVTYVLGDIVVVGDYAYYLCTLANVSSATFPPDAAKWQLIFDATQAVIDTDADRVAAGLSADAAALSETNAGLSADAASTSEGNAHDSEVAAGLSQDAAATSETNAGTSATEAANQAAALKGTSTTPNIVDVGGKTFITQAGKQFNVGNFMTIVDTANPSVNILIGQITSYSGTTLTIYITDAVGSGTVVNWQLYISGARGVAGATGATGPAGTGSGDMLRSANLSDLVNKPTSLVNLGAVAKVGDTMTGDLLIQNSTTNAALRLDKVGSGSESVITGRSANKNRWTLRLGDNAAETGSNTGSAFRLDRWDDAGAVLTGTPIAIDRSNGRMTLTARLIIAPPTAAVWPSIELHRTDTGAGAGINAFVAGVSRWSLRLGDVVAETGGNAGSPFILYNHNDVGAITNEALRIERTDGLLILAGNPTAPLHAATKQYVDNKITDDVIRRSNILAPHEDLVVSRTNVTTVNATAEGVVLVNAAGVSRRFANLSENPLITTVGVNGRDVGSEAANTWYYIWAIGKDDGTLDTLFSIKHTLADPPTWPTDYNFRGLIGAVRNDGSLNFVNFFQRGNSVMRASLVVLADGIAGTFTAVSLTAAVPVNATEVLFTGYTWNTVGTGQVAGMVVPEGTGTTPTYGHDGTFAGFTVTYPDFVQFGTSRMLLSTPQQIKYRVQGHMIITATGWVF